MASNLSAQARINQLRRENTSLRGELRIVSQTIDETMLAMGNRDLTQSPKQQNLGSPKPTQNADAFESEHDISVSTSVAEAEREIRVSMASIKYFRKKIREMKEVLEENANKDRIGELQGEYNQLKRKAAELESEQHTYIKALAHQPKNASLPERIHEANKKLAFAKDRFRKVRQKCREEEKLAKQKHSKVVAAESSKRLAEGRTSRNFGPSNKSILTSLTEEDITVKSAELHMLDSETTSSIRKLRDRSAQLEHQLKESFLDLDQLHLEIKQAEQQQRVNLLKLRQLNYKGFGMPTSSSAVKMSTSYSSKSVGLRRRHASSRPNATSVSVTPV